MLCNNCQQKATLTVPGKCKNCGGVTTHFAYGLCSTCAQKLDQCQWCEVPLKGSQPTVTVSSAYFTKVREATDNGKTFKSMHIGEEIHIEMEEDQYSGKEWDVKQPLSSSFKLKSKGQFSQNAQNGQYGTRTFVFEVAGTAGGDIELCEVQRMWSWWGGGYGSSTPVQGGKQFKATFQVK